MTLEVIQRGGSGRHVAEVIKPSVHEPPGTLVYTEPRVKYFSKFRTVPLVNDVNGANMAIDATAGGTPVGVYNGGDSVLWTATALGGTWDFTSTAQAHTGTRSVDATATTNNDQAQFAGAAVDMSNYSSVSGWIYITGWSGSGVKNVSLSLRSSGIAVGNSVNLSGAIDTTLFDTWQKFNIQKSSFGVVTDTINQLVATTVSTGGGPPPNYYLDDLQIEETGGGVDYFARPRTGYEYHLTHLGVTFVDGLTGSYPINLSYNKILNLAALPNGFTFSVRQAGEIIFSSSFKNLFDLLRLPVASTLYGISDGTNTLVKIGFDMTEANIYLNEDKADNVKVTINDDMSDLLEFNVFTRGTDILRH